MRIHPVNFTQNSRGLRIVFSGNEDRAEFSCERRPTFSHDLKRLMLRV
jgi:hypothetical protein